MEKFDYTNKAKKSSNFTLVKFPTKGYLGISTKLRNIAKLF